MSSRRSSERRHVDFRVRCEPEADSRRADLRPETVPLLTFSPSPNQTRDGDGSSGPSSPTSLSSISSVNGMPQRKAERPCSSPQGIYTAADLLRGCTDLQYADSVSGSPSVDELSLELERAKLRNDPGLLAVASRLVHDVLRKAKQRAIGRIKHDAGTSIQITFAEPEAAHPTEHPATYQTVYPGGAETGSQRRRVAWQRRLRAIVCTFFSCFGLRRGSF